MGGVLRWVALLVLGLVSCFVLGYVCVLLIREGVDIAALALIAVALFPAGLFLRALARVWREESRRAPAVRPERVAVAAADPDLGDVSIWDVRRPQAADPAL